MPNRPTCGFAVIALCAFALGTARAIPPPTGRDSRGEPVFPICVTESSWSQKRAQFGLDRANGGSCTTEGPCDDPASRDATNLETLVVRVVVHVMRGGAEDTLNVITPEVVAAQMQQLNLDFATYGVGFVVVNTRFHDQPCISAYSPTQDDWRLDIEAMKDTYAEDPTHKLNIFTGCQEPGSFGTLLGIATFPWDADALTARGGVWVNSAYFGPGNHTLTHETGHALGLWHTQHGVDEVSDCVAPCAENPHAPGDPNADSVGDFCSDTPATPGNNSCAEPPGVDCFGTSWTAFGPTDITNYMGYAPDACASRFSPQQMARVHCWTKNALASLLQGSGPPGPRDELINLPNPFNPGTTFRFTLTETVRTTLQVFDVGGHLVARLLDETRAAGVQDVPWNGAGANGQELASGVYYARLTAGDVVRTRQIVLLK